jgi:hypothetical protein
MEYTAQDGKPLLVGLVTLHGYEDWPFVLVKLPGVHSHVQFHASELTHDLDPQPL